MAETFLAAWAARAHYRREVGGVRPWLYGIAVNLPHRHHRTRLQHTRLSQRLCGILEHLDDEQDRAAERIDAHTRLTALAAAITALPDRDRDVLLLTSLAGLDHAEVAAALKHPARHRPVPAASPPPQAAHHRRG